MLRYLSKYKKWILPTLALLVIFCSVAITGLIIALDIFNRRLNNVALAVEETAKQHIITNVALNTNLPIDSKFKIIDDFKVDVNMIVETVIPIHVDVPVNNSILVPFKIGVKNYIKLDTTILITEDFHALVEDTIILDQKFNIPAFKKKGINLPIKASIPLKENLKISINEPIKIYSIVPIDLLIIDTIPVGLNIKVPVNLNVPVRIPINTTANISFPKPISVVSDIPVSMNIPVDIQLSKTDLSPCLMKIANALRGLTKINSTEHDNIKKALN